MQIDSRSGAGLAIIEKLLEKRHDILEILTKVSSRRSAIDEIERSIKAIAGAQWERARYEPKADKIAVFLPSNNLLYSYVLFAVIPAMYSNRVTLRVSHRVATEALAIHEILSDFRSSVGAKISMLRTPQREFLHLCADADAIVFNGKHSNALIVAETLLSSKLFLAFGSGPNPFVIGPDAELGSTIKALVRARLYNSGQDCLAPDLVFVARTILDDFLNRLSTRLEQITIGSRLEEQTDVSPLSYRDAFIAAREFLHRNRDVVHYGGEADENSMLIAPSIVVQELINLRESPELFAPIFSIVIYDDPRDIQRWLSTEAELRRGMYLSLFGEPRIIGARIGSSVVLRSMTAFDAENGNEPLGGFGIEASFVQVNGIKVARPLLLSKELGSRSDPKVVTSSGSHQMTLA